MQIFKRYSRFQKEILMKTDTLVIEVGVKASNVHYLQQNDNTFIYVICIYFR